MKIELFWLVRALGRPVPQIKLLEDVDQVPEGFISDGTTRPWYLSWFVNSVGPELEASIKHDYNIQSCVTIGDWNDQADQFLQDMKDTLVSRPRAYLYFWFAKSYGVYKLIKGELKR